MAKNKSYTSPKGVAVFPHLIEPDTKFNANGEYNVRLELDPSDPGVDAFLRFIEAEATASYEETIEKLNASGGPGKAKAKQLKLNSPVKDVYDDEGEPTGLKQVSFKTAATYKDKTGAVKSKKVKFFDASATPKPFYPESLWGGSEIKVAFAVARYYIAGQQAAGASLYINAVQVIKLVEGGGGNADEFGFGGEEGGFAADDGGFGAGAEVPDEGSYGEANGYDL